jgi:AcrR family transcriptional regulator
MTSAHKRARQAETERNDLALLRAAREVLTEDGVHASVATIAARAGVGIGSLYRRYRTKQELFQRLCTIALRDYLTAAEEALTIDDPWDGLTHYVQMAISFGPGSLAAIAGSIEVTREMATLNAKGDDAVEALVARAHRAGALRADVSAVDIALLIEQLGRSPMLEQLHRQGRADLIEAAINARSRIIAIALDGLRPPTAQPLPGTPPDYELFRERWAQDTEPRR